MPMIRIIEDGDFDPKDHSFGVVADLTADSVPSKGDFIQYARDTFYLVEEVIWITEGVEDDLRTIVIVRKTSTLPGQALKSSSSETLL